MVNETMKCKNCGNVLKDYVCINPRCQICENCGHSITFHGSENRGLCGKRVRGIYCKCKKFKKRNF